MKSHLESVLTLLKYINAPADEIADVERMILKYGNLTIDEYLERVN